MSLLIIIGRDFSFFWAYNLAIIGVFHWFSEIWHIDVEKWSLHITLNKNPTEKSNDKIPFLFIYMLISGNRCMKILIVIISE